MTGVGPPNSVKNSEWWKLSDEGKQMWKIEWWVMSDGNWVTIFCWPNRLLNTLILTQKKKSLNTLWPSTRTVAPSPKRGLSTSNRTIMWHLIRRIAPNLRRKPFIGSSNSDPTRTRHYYTSVVAPRQSGASTGLYGFDHLKSPNGFQRFVDEAIERYTLSINVDFQKCISKSLWKFLFIFEYIYFLYYC